MSLTPPTRIFNSSLRPSTTSATLRGSLRYASLNSAIGRGIRRSQGVEDTRSAYDESRDRSRSERSSRGRSREDVDPYDFPEPDFEGARFNSGGRFRGLPREYQRPQAPRKSWTQNNPADTRTGREVKSGSRNPPKEFDEEEFIRSGSLRPVTRSTTNHHEGRRSSQHSVSSYENRENSEGPPRASGHDRANRKSPGKKSERVKEHVKVPDTIPYTTPASEFIYGTTAVEAALRCSQRQLYKLYLYQSADDEDLGIVKAVLRKLALAKNVKVKLAFAEWDRILDKMSAGRPHNGCILEASPLPRTPVQALRSVTLEDDHFQLELAPQTREEAAVNGTNDSIKINSSVVQQRRRYPVVLLLDGIVDPGNLGAIIRSAYYLGVDAVVFAGRNSAPLSPVTIKASAGAAENMTLLNVKNEVDFIQRSKANGWRFYAADALSPGATYLDPTEIHKEPPTATAELTADDSQAEHEHEHLVGHSPSVIMMGNEGSGLSNHIRSHADAIVSIPGARFSDPARVDSLNVSVAAALLMETFLRVPLGIGPIPRKEGRR